MTERLKQALEVVDIRLLDHLVVGGMDIVSFAERGWLYGIYNDENHQQTSGDGDIPSASAVPVISLLYRKIEID